MTEEIKKILREKEKLYLEKVSVMRAMEEEISWLSIEIDNIKKRGKELPF